MAVAQEHTMFGSTENKTERRGEDQVAEGKEKKKTKSTEDKVCRDKGNKSRRVSQSERRKSGERALISDKAGLRLAEGQWSLH